jgi:Domain of unknown function (DUF4390)
MPAVAAAPTPRRPRWAAVLALALLVALPLPAQNVELTSFEARRSEEGHLVVDYAVDFALSAPVEAALAKAVPLHFVAEVGVFRSRWYWTDKRVARTSRTWRVVYQPLTSTWRVTFGDLSQTFATQAEALGVMRRASAWKVADAERLDEGASHYVEFAFRLDTSQLPRPMQIGIGSQPEWALSVERAQPVP